MQITEVRIKLTEDSSERLQAFCSITFDNCFVIRDLKIIDGAHGPFVAMPSRKLTAHCPGCGYKNHLRAAFCNQCGRRLSERCIKEEDGRAKLYADIAHPINSACREMIQQRVITSYREELERSKQPGYRSTYDDLDRDLDVVGSVACQVSDAPSPSVENERRRTADAPGAVDLRPATATPEDARGFESRQSPQGPHKSPARAAPQIRTPNSESRRPARESDDHFGEGIF